MEMIFDRDPLTRSLQRFHYDFSNDQVVIQDTQDVTALVEANKEVRNNPALQPSKKSELRRVASIPMNIWQHLRTTWERQGLGWEERQEAMKRWLNDPDNRAFRTDTSRV